MLRLFGCLVILFSYSVVPVNGAAAEKLVGINSALALSQSLPWIAKETGLFHKHNLNFEPVFIQSSSAVAAAMLGGEADIGLLGAVGIVRASIQGATDFVFIGAVKNILTHSIVAKPEIKKPEQLKGKTLGVTPIGSNSHYFAIQALQRIGLDPSRDVTIRQTGGDFASLMALTNGTVDAMTMLSYGETAVAQGYHYLIYGPDIQIPYAATSIVTRRSVMTQRPQVVGSYMRAMAEAAKIFFTYQEVTYRILSKYLRINDRKILESSYKTEIKALEPRLEIKTDAVQAILAEAAATDSRAKKFKAAEFIDRRYLDELEKSRFFENLWGAKAIKQ